MLSGQSLCGSMLWCEATPGARAGPAQNRDSMLSRVLSLPKPVLSTVEEDGRSRIEACSGVEREGLPGAAPAPHRDSLLSRVLSLSKPVLSTVEGDGRSLYRSMRISGEVLLALLSGRLQSGGPGWPEVIARVVGEAGELRAISVDHIDLGIPITVGHESDPLAIGRPGWQPAVRSGVS